MAVGLQYLIFQKQKLLVMEKVEECDNKTLFGRVKNFRKTPLARGVASYDIDYIISQDDSPKTNYKVCQVYFLSISNKY